jgi:hypothetical protein
MTNVERKLQFGELEIIWDEISKIDFCNKEGEILCSLDPIELSCIYAAYRQMQKELLEDELVREKG